MSDLTHFNAQGEAHMVDVSEKDRTHRIASARCTVHMSKKTLQLVATGQAGKGDVLGIARTAGIMAAKRTSDLIPLCHPLPISKVSIEFELDHEQLLITVLSTVKTTGQTGVEMEALTAASVASLTIYDMLKAAQKDIKINDLMIILKDGGKSGRFEQL